MTILTKTVNGEEIPLNAEEIADFEAREAAHELEVAARALIRYRELRRVAYPPIEEVTVALIEKEEGRPEALNALMVARAAIKALYPKPAE